MRGKEQRLYLCSLPYHTHLLLLLLLFLLLLLHTHHHTHSLLPTPCKTLTSAPVCRDHSYEKRKGGKTRDGEEKTHPRISPCCCSARARLFLRDVRAQELHSRTASTKHTQTSVTPGIGRLVFQINSRTMKRQ